VGVRLPGRHGYAACLRDTDTDFRPVGNMGDRNLRRLADEGWRRKRRT